MVFFIIERQCDSSSIISGDAFSFSSSDRDNRVSIQVFSDQSVNIFRIVPFIEDVGIRLSRLVTLNEEFFCMKDIMNQLLRNLESGDDLSVSIDRDRCFKESFPGFPGSLGII